MGYSYEKYSTKSVKQDCFSWKTFFNSQQIWTPEEKLIIQKLPLLTDKRKLSV